MYVHLIFYMETPSVRVLVVGDSGVGKHAVTIICRLYSRDSIDYDKPSSLWTTGCDVHVLLKIFEPEGQEIFVNFSILEVIANTNSVVEHFIIIFMELCLFMI
ncbi:putative sigma-54 interaction domain, ATP-binding site 1 [Plasmopara halstedii]